MTWSGRIATIFGVLWLASTARAGGEPSEVPLPQGFSRQSIRDDLGEHKYVLYLPSDYRPDRAWPVVLFLHGAGEKGRDGLLPLAGGLAVALEEGRPVPFIAVFPQCEDVDGRELTGWLADSPDARRALHILNDVESRYSIDPDQRILAGWSMGGYGAWSLAATHPERWSAVLAISGGRIEGGTPLDQLAAAGVPVWAVHGRDDQLVSCDRSSEAIDALVAKGGNGLLSLLNGVGHDAWRRVFASDEAINWLVNPESGSPTDIDLSRVDPLPPRSRFYKEHLVRRFRIPDSLAVRLGNRALAEISPELPELVPQSSMQGTLDDIHRTLGNADDPIQVTLSEVSYRCSIADCSLQGISGGRLRVEFAFQPLLLIIGRTELTSRRHQARTSPITVELGRHRPMPLVLELQPVMDSGRLRLRLLRQRFEMDPSNWYIHPPDEVVIRSDQYTRRHVVSGVVGSLYQRADELQDEILEVVPRLLTEVEDELHEHDVPRLARMLSPLPGVTPEIEAGVSHVRTDRQGLSLVLGLQVLTRGAGGISRLNSPLRLDDLGRTRELGLGISLDTITDVSRQSVQQGQTRINVLDIAGSKFEQLADPAVMRRIFPDLPDFAPGESLQTVLRLLDPLLVQNLERDGDTAKLHHLMLRSQAVSLDVARQFTDGTSRPVGRVVFALAQPVVIDSPDRSDAAGRNVAIQARWLPECEVKFVRAESWKGSDVPKVDAGAFEELFRDTWLSWSAEHGTQQLTLEAARIGNTQLWLDSMNVEGRRLDLAFEAERGTR